MGARTISGRGRGAVIALLVLSIGASAPAAGQSPAGRVRPDYRSADPRALVRAWGSTPREQRGELAAAMIARRAAVLPALRDAARSGDRAEKMFACAMIAEMRDRDGVDALLAATADGDVKVRRRAATALRILADPRAADRLREIARTDGDRGVLKIALAALGRLGFPRDVRLIAPFLDDANDGVRVVAAASLAMLGDERGLDLVIQATHSADPSAQKNATYALGFFRAPAADARLGAILDDPAGAWKSYALMARAERRVAAQPIAEQVATLEVLASGRSRNLAEWSVDRLTDIGSPEAAGALRKVRDRVTPVGAMAARRLILLEGKR